MTYRLLIVDDEAVERNALKLMVSKNLNDFEVVGEAENGLEAIERARTLRPDIVLMDIKMPGMDGLTAIDEIRKSNEEICFIVLSAHNDFEFAQTALKLGADDYLLKPARFNKLIEALQAIVYKLELKRLKAMQTQNMQKKIESLRPDIEGRILSSIVAGINTCEMVKHYAYFLDIELLNCICLVVRFLKPESEKRPLLQTKEDKESVLGQFKDMLRTICPYFLSDYAFESIVTIIPIDSQWTSERVSQWAVELNAFVKSSLRKIGFSHTAIGVSDIVVSADCLNKAYKQAMQAAQQNTDLLEQTQDSSEIYRKEMKLCEKIAIGDLDQSMVIFDELVNSYVLLSPDNIAHLKTRIRDLIIIIKRKLVNELNQPAVFNQLVEARLCQLESLCTGAQLVEIVQSYIQDCVNLSDSSGSGSSRMLDSAVNYVTLNFTNSFSLEDVANKLGVSAPYLSRLFKHKLGKNFIDYITELRIQYAKELLCKKDKSIKEITFMVGYNSQTYFCKVFKKAVGVSASQYMNQTYSTDAAK